MAPLSDTGQCRIGLISRLDFPSEGYRRGLLRQAKKIFKESDVRFVVIAGGLVSAKYITEKQRKLTRDIRALTKQIKALEKILAEDSAGATEEPTDRSAVRAKLRSLEAERRRKQGFLDELQPEEVAKQLSEQIPAFENATGERINVYVFSSPAFDGDIGELVCKYLAEYRSEDVRIYHSEDDLIPIRQTGQTFEVAVPVKSVWMRGDYYSTAVERVLKDRGKSLASSPTDLSIVGGFGVTINKQQGEASRRYVAVPALHKLGGVRVNENQIGVMIVTVFKDRPDPDVRVISLKDAVRDELDGIPLPRSPNDRRKRLLEYLREHGRVSTGQLARATKLSAASVTKELAPLDNRTRGGRRPANWPGLRFDSTANRWGFDSYWLREHLKYPSLPPTGERHVDNIVAYGCLHSGCVKTDYQYFLEEVPRVMLERGANILVGAGDFVEGTKHNLILRGEVYAGMNVTVQEQFAGGMIAKVTSDVFRARFERELIDRGRKAKSYEWLLAAVDQALITNVLIPGNHDLWVKDAGHDPMVVMTMTAIDKVFTTITALLNQHGLPCSQDIYELVKRKFVVYWTKGPEARLIASSRFRLPSGLMMSIQHPHMARAQTTSIRPQQMLGWARDCQVVIGANFHVSEFLASWEPGLGQRVCMEIGTMKLHSDFEDHKLKVVDHGFGWMRIESVDGRIVAVENTFYTGRENPSLLDPNQAYEDLFTRLNLSS